MNLLSRLPYQSQAVFNSPEVHNQGRCLDGTQCHVLNTIQDWATSPNTELMFWLHGMAGTGKSSIARTVAECLYDGKGFTTNQSLDQDTFLGASFFFSAESSRNHVGEVFSTIAKTLAQKFPALEHHITEILRGDPDIGKKILPEQFSLIYEPLMKLSKAEVPPIRLVIVIDALDECQDQRQARLLLKSILRLRNITHIQVRVLVTSRPESYDFIARTISQGVIRSFALEKISRPTLESETFDDITLFMTHEFREVREFYSLPDGWPPGHKFEGLVQKADGLFIYAATICRFIFGDGNLPGQIPEQRLEEVLQGSRGEYSPEEKIAEIYVKVLKFPGIKLSQREKEQMYDVFRRILGCLIVVSEPISLGTLAHFLRDSEKRLTENLRLLHAIVKVPKDDSQCLSFFHKSFRDYLLDKERSWPDFWIEETEAHQAMFDSCLDTMQQELHQDMCDLRLPGTLVSEISQDSITQHVSQHLQYACLYWVNHLAQLDVPQRKRAGLTDDGKIHKLLLDKFLYWLEALSLMGKLHESILIIHILQSLIDVSTASR